jgi:polyvinyl alcohol dehydrogenase (cytochrome)
MANGRNLLVIPQKAGIGYALDPDKDGAIVWQYRFGRGSGMGGVWGTAVDGQNAYFPDNNTQAPGGMHAVRLEDGQRVWNAPPPAQPLCAAGGAAGAAPARGPAPGGAAPRGPAGGPPAGGFGAPAPGGFGQAGGARGGPGAPGAPGGARGGPGGPAGGRGGPGAPGGFGGGGFGGGGGCSAAQSAAVTAVPGAVFSGSADGGMRAYAATDGSILWEFNTNRTFDTVNGVTANGGTMDLGGAVVVNKMVFFTSGNGGFGRAGNVLLAFGID